MINLDLTYTTPQSEIFFEQQSKYIVVRKGRRLGTTRGAAQAFIEFLVDGTSPLLWVDTINGNIDRYFDRYFLPVLKQLPASWWTWNVQKRELKINGNICDFRSADKPESIEGFGYKKIFLNEAGIILKDDYLYTNAILPMLLDFPDSQLIAAGVPKGKFKKDGTEHIFYQLHEAALNDTSGKYATLHYTTYDNPFLEKEEIDNLISTIRPLGHDIIDQEIFGEFVEKSGENPFFVSYDEKKHESVLALFDPHKPISISIDFNVNPFAVNFSHLWADGSGQHCHVFDEADIVNGSIPAMIDLIKNRYGNYLPSCRLTGDATGQKKSIEQRDNASYYIQLQRGLGLNPKQVQVPKSNPTQENSRSDCNYVLYHFPDFKINPKTCPNTARDMKIIQCDSFGQIIKRDRKHIYQQGDHGDGIRYLIDSWLSPWIKWHQRQRTVHKAA